MAAAAAAVIVVLAISSNFSSPRVFLVYSLPSNVHWLSINEMSHHTDQGLRVHAYMIPIIPLLFQYTEHEIKCIYACLTPWQCRRRTS